MEMMVSYTQSAKVTENLLDKRLNLWYHGPMKNKEIEPDTRCPGFIEKQKKRGRDLMRSLWYLATPYDKFPPNRLAAYNAAITQASILVESGVVVYSPIIHNHPIGLQIGRQLSNFWLEFDRSFMESCHGLIVCKLATWEKSKGISFEINWFSDNSIPVVYMEPGTVPEGLDEALTSACGIMAP